MRIAKSWLHQLEKNHASVTVINTVVFWRDLSFLCQILPSGEYFYFLCKLIHPDKYGSMKVEDIKSPHGKKGDGGYKYLSEWPPEEQIQMIKSYYKFMFVRHPLERLLSAYRDKVRRTARIRSNIEHVCEQIDPHRWI